MMAEPLFGASRKFSDSWTSTISPGPKPCGGVAVLVGVRVTVGVRDGVEVLDAVGVFVDVAV
jgi:hypothetical protein